MSNLYNNYVNFNYKRSKKIYSNDKKISIKNVFKVYGKDPKLALKMLKDGFTKEEVFKKTGMTIGVQNASFEIRLPFFYGLAYRFVFHCLRHMIYIYYFCCIPIYLVWLALK